MTELEILREALQKIYDLAHEDDKEALYLKRTGKLDRYGESYAYVCGKIEAIAGTALRQTAKKHPQKGGETNEAKEDPHRQTSNAGAEGTDQGGRPGPGEVAGVG